MPRSSRICTAARAVAAFTLDDAGAKINLLDLRKQVGKEALVGFAELTERMAWRVALDAGSSSRYRRVETTHGSMCRNPRSSIEL
jgi:hypothetical protein